MEIVVVGIVFGAFVLIADQIRRLFGQAMVNRTIRVALEKDTASVPLLIEKLESRGPVTIAVTGATFVVLGLIVAVLTALDAEVVEDGWTAAAVSAGVGAALLAFDFWNRKRSARALAQAKPEA